MGDGRNVQRCKSAYGLCEGAKVDTGRDSTTCCPRGIEATRLARSANPTRGKEATRTARGAVPTRYRVKGGSGDRKVGGRAEPAALPRPATLNPIT